MADLKTDLAECLALHGKATRGRWLATEVNGFDAVLADGNEAYPVCCNETYYPTPVNEDDQRAIAALHNLFHDHGEELLAVVRRAALYDELLYAVGNKYESETRHETALRYIRQAEQGSDDAAAMQQEADR